MASNRTIKIAPRLLMLMAGWLCIIAAASWVLSRSWYTRPLTRAKVNSFELPFGDSGPLSPEVNDAHWLDTIRLSDEIPPVDELAAGRPALISTLYDLGARRIWMLRSEESLQIIVELPTDSPARQAVIDRMAGAAMIGKGTPPAPLAGVGNRYFGVAIGVDTPAIESGGWPLTTKKFDGNLVYITPSGVEHLVDLGGPRVATVAKTIDEGLPNEFDFELEFLRHKEGFDVYALKYRIPGEQSAYRGSSPKLYAGRETVIHASEVGTFILRPKDQ